MFQFPKISQRDSRMEILSGLTVALALVPEAVAFAFVAGVDPMVGLHAAFMMGLITSLLGGRPGMVSGATGAMAVVIVTLVASHGIEYLFAAVLLAGLIQIAAGMFRLGKFIRIVPHPVMMGFVNGLAIVIFLSQLGQFKVPSVTGELVWLSGEPLYIMLGLVALTMAIIHFLPRFTTAIPSSLAAIIVVTLLVQLLDLDTRTVIDFVRSMTGDEATTLSGGLPEFSFPQVPMTLDTLIIILPYACILAAVGLIESLLTLTVLDEMTGTRGHSNRECLGQGTANMVNGVFGGMGGCAMIGQSMINVRSGGRGRLSSSVAALALLGFILFASGLIEMIPLAALVGVMFIVVLGTFEWATFRIITRIPKADLFVIALVTIVTVFTDLALAVFVGVLFSALRFAWEHAKQIETDIVDEPERRVYLLNGPLFFSSISGFMELFNVDEDPDLVIVDFARSQVCDHSALEAIDNLAAKYENQGKQLKLRHLSAECRKMLIRARSHVEVNPDEDPIYHVASDKLD